MHSQPQAQHKHGVSHRPDSTGMALHGSANGMHMMMQMYFESSTHVTLWLKSWHTATLPQYLVSLLGLALLAVAAEALASFRSRLAKQTASPSDPADGFSGGAAGEPLLGHLSYRASTPSRLRIVLAALYAANIAIAYLLMLAVMTYNVGYFVAVVCGFGLGHFLYGASRMGRSGGDPCCPEP